MYRIAAVVWLILSGVAADVSGTWTGTFSVPGSDHKEPQYFILKQSGKKLTGSGGPDAVEQYPIVNGSIEDDAAKFELSSGDWKFKYDLKTVGQEMTGTLYLKSKEGDSRRAQVILKRAETATRTALQPNAQNAVRGIADLFDRFPIVAIGEGHSLREAGDFYVSLVKDRRFPRK